MRQAWIVALGVMLVASPALADESSALKTQKDLESYGIGVTTARNFKRQGIEVDLDAFVKGLRDGLTGGKLLMSEKDLRVIMNTFQQDLRQKQKLAVKVASIENSKQGAEFLAANAKKPGVVTLPDGLQYKILKEGSGRKPADADKVEVRYRGTLLNGYEFDGTDLDGPPANLEIGGGIIRGLREALKLMSVGSKWEVYVPSALAYGPRGVGADIGPNATLIFEVELLAIK